MDYLACAIYNLVQQKHHEETYMGLNFQFGLPPTAEASLTVPDPIPAIPA